jgi:precorrin-6Y C5,15-methyltransferase (decarboxylating)
VSRWLSILGIGEDGVDGLCAAARALVETASLVVGGARHLSLVAPLIRGDAMAWPSPLSDAFPTILARRGQPVVVLASGDPYCFGVGTTLRPVVPIEETVCIPVPSAFSLAGACLGWSVQDVAQISLCGRPLEALFPLLQPGAQILALAADATTPALVADLLRQRGFGASLMHVLQALGGPRERIMTTTAEIGPAANIDPLNLIALHIRADPDARVIPLARGLPDRFFEHDGQLTKSEVRAVTLASLAPRAGELLWDIGCGCGAIGIEFMLCHPANRAVGIEARADRAARAARNALALGVPGLRVVVGEAPAALADLPGPDAVFVGGGACDAFMLEAAWSALRRGGRLVANAVTVETEARLFAARDRLGGTLTRISIDRLDSIGSMHGFRRAMTVTQWAATKQ